MKKMVAVVLMLILLAPCAMAEDIDLSGLSFAELAALRDRCQMEMMGREEWQQVTIPAGLWKVGEDIPAGHWVFTYDPSVKTLMKTGISYGDVLREQKSIDVMKSTEYYGHTFTEADPSFDLLLEDGYYIQVNNGPVIVTPYTGKPDLGFK